ncbi:hypothetical protein QBC46DRAFT_397358 [Diplogelasinospora grovesii]|uniref:Peptidase metallopeptidase domain-containing protein n=1 Tax=Diplogelasinospora grovesii TaxID=303347 RepID=A0AAN6MYZ9_9PEZI|nr:hypothetical protein QBC46DRAFT_397358 [Diplogelasinospora grovesii]
MIPNGPNRVGVLWTGNRIPFCIDTTLDINTRQTIEDALVSAWGLWVAEGVRGLVFEPGSQEECQAGESNTYLSVTISETSMATTLGMGGAGGRMMLVMDENFGLGDRVANFAHEIGHAWGLVHEHQRPDVWTADYGGTATSNTFTFNCQNLKDYQSTLSTNGYTPGSQPAIQMCLTLSAAGTAHFGGGLNYLPYEQGSVVTTSKFDEKSIMLYASNTGGIVDAGNRRDVYTFANGGQVGPNRVPSQVDVENLQTLYGIQTSSVGQCLAYMPCSPFQSLFSSLTGCIKP